MQLSINERVRELPYTFIFSLARHGVSCGGSPRSASEILNRLNEVSFNAALLKELRMIALLRQVADPGNSEGAQWAGMRIHRIANTAKSPSRLSRCFGLAPVTVLKNLYSCPTHQRIIGVMNTAYGHPSGEA